VREDWNHIPKNLKNVLILIDDGKTFEGTKEQFENCFFSNATKINVIDFVKKDLSEPNPSTVDFFFIKNKN
jgi:hypothetical protein